MRHKLPAAGVGLTFALVAFASAHAGEVGYVTGSSVNCREKGSASSTIVKVLKRSDQAVIVDRVAGWANLDFGEEACWVLAQYVGSQALADATEVHALKGAPSISVGAKAKAKARSSAGPSTSTARNSARRSSRRSSGYSAAGCPCSGSRVCVGPQGGRYCITSGGNKRYGV